MVVSYCSMIAGPSIAVAARAAARARRTAWPGGRADRRRRRSPRARASARATGRRRRAPAARAAGSGICADRHHADVDELDLGLEAVAVLGLVGPVEALAELGQPGGRRSRRPGRRSGPRSPGRRSGSRPAAARRGGPRARRPARAAASPGPTGPRSGLRSRSRSASASAWRSVATNSCCEVGRQQPGGGDDPRVAAARARAQSRARSRCHTRTAGRRRPRRRARTRAGHSRGGPS